MSTSNTLQFDEITGAVAVATIVLSTFGKAIVSKAADATWAALAAHLNDALPSQGSLLVVYRAQSTDPQLEIVLGYPGTRALRRDRKNQRLYLAIAQGFALGKVPAKGESISLLPALPEDLKTRPTEFAIRRVGTTGPRSK